MMHDLPIDFLWVSAYMLSHFIITSNETFNLDLAVANLHLRLSLNTVLHRARYVDSCDT